MKHLDQIWKDWIGSAVLAIMQHKIALEDYIMTPKGAQETVEWLAVMFAFCAIDGLWATWNLWLLLLSAIW